MKNARKTQISSLRLNRETVRVLGAIQLADVVGGSASGDTNATNCPGYSSSNDGPTHRTILKN